jgi:uncharacterized protein (DUF169 family)
MKMKRRLERTFGGTWFPISFLPALPDSAESGGILEGIRFCEAIDKARVHPVLVKPEQSPCMGTKLAFGHGENLAESMIEKLVGEKSFSETYARELIRRTPALERPVMGVGLNLETRPDLYLAPLQPMHAMVLLQRYEAVMEKTADQNLSSVFSLCANVAVKAHQTRDIALSFGCEDARTFGRFSRDRMFVGLPRELAAKLV